MLLYLEFDQSDDLTDRISLIGQRAFLIFSFFLFLLVWNDKLKAIAT